MSPQLKMSLILRTIAMLRFGLQLMTGLVLISSSPLWLSLAESSSVYASQEEIRTLEHKTPVERELADGQAHSYRVFLNSGQYVRVMVEQKGKVFSLCAQSGKESAFVTPTEAARVSTSSVREIFRLIESGEMHFVERPDRSVIACLVSLKRVGEFRARKRPIHEYTRNNTKDLSSWEGTEREE